MPRVNYESLAQFRASATKADHIFAADVGRIIEAQGYRFLGAFANGQEAFAEHVRDPRRTEPAFAVESQVVVNQALGYSLDNLAPSLFYTKLTPDLLIWHPTKWPHRLGIEAKFQESDGSATDKFVYAVTNIKGNYPCPGLIVYGGTQLESRYAQEHGVRWLREQPVEGRYMGCATLEEFARWAQAYL